MIKNITCLFATLLILAACTGKEDPVQEPVAVGFTLAQETKAGFVGEVDGNILRATGFGVYGYVTPDSDWATSGATTKPRFMTNQKVQYEGSDGWVYRPLKYWPNEASDKVSFFAYAPYVPLDALPDDFGIVSLPGKDDVGTPKIGYKVATNPAFGVDLMYGVAATTHANPGITAGQPFLDMTKMLLGDKMDFRFKHALARLVMTVDAVSSGPVDWVNTRVVVERVALETEPGIQVLYLQGNLNLETGTWENLSGQVELLTDLVPAEFLFVPGNEDSVTFFTQQPTGVTGSAQSLFGPGVDGLTPAQLLYIPGPAGLLHKVPLIVTYRVIVRDPGEPEGYRTAATTAKVYLDIQFAAGETATINLHLNAGL